MLVDVTVDGMAEDAFRHSIETMLREGRADEAARRLKVMLSDHCGENRALPGNFLRLSLREIAFAGWHLIAETISELDQAGEPVSAIAFDLNLEPFAPLPGHEPSIDTFFYFDNAWPFSECDRSALLEGFDDRGPVWQSEHADTNSGIIAISGLAEASAALASLKRTIDEDAADKRQAADAWMLGACYLSVLFHIAVRDMVLSGGLPRPMAVLAGNDHCYPNFSAPVLAARVQAPAGDEFLLSLKFADEPEPVEVIETPVDDGMEALLGPQQPVAAGPEPGDDPEAWHLPPPGLHVTGTQLRKKLVTQESIEELRGPKRPSLLQRILLRT